MTGESIMDLMGLIIGIMFYILGSTAAIKGYQRIKKREYY